MLRQYPQKTHIVFNQTIRYRNTDGPAQSWVLSYLSLYGRAGMQHKSSRYVLHFRLYSMHLRITNLSHLLCCRYIFYDKMRRSKPAIPTLSQATCIIKTKPNRLCIRKKIQTLTSKYANQIPDTREAWGSEDIRSSNRGTHGAINLWWIWIVLEIRYLRKKAVLLTAPTL